MVDAVLLNRYLGAMVGVHVGDAIGAPYETWGPKKIAQDIENRGGLTFFDYENPWKHELGPKILPAGRPTDDSDQTADLAHSLIECSGLDTEHLREALRDSVVRHKSRLWDGTALGAGGTTKKALSDDPKEVEAAMQNNIGTNGSLMRCMPLSLFLFNKVSDKTIARWDYVVDDMSAVTHAHTHAKQACREHFFLTWGILLGSNMQELREQICSGNSRQSMLGRRVGLLLEDHSCFPIDPGAWPARGTAEFSLYAAMWCFLHSTSFEDGIEKAVRIGGDTDTYAAIAGGLLGAYYGYDAIPTKWKNTILGHDVMVGYAEKLHEMGQAETVLS